jgi:hypothetical protein
VLDDDPLDVFDVEIDDVPVFVLMIVFVNLDVLEDELDPVEVLEIALDLLNDGDDDDVFELF